jgi:hypothetical protein
MSNFHFDLSLKLSQGASLCKGGGGAHLPSKSGHVDDMMLTVGSQNKNGNNSFAVQCVCTYVSFVSICLAFLYPNSELYTQSCDNFIYFPSY